MELNPTGPRVQCLKGSAHRFFLGITLSLVGERGAQARYSRYGLYIPDLFQDQGRAPSSPLPGEGKGGGWGVGGTDTLPRRPTHPRPSLVQGRGEEERRRRSDRIVEAEFVRILVIGEQFGIAAPVRHRAQRLVGIIGGHMVLQLVAEAPRGGGVARA